MASLSGFDPRASLIETCSQEPALPEQALLLSGLDQIFSLTREQPGYPSWTPELLHDRRRPSASERSKPITRASVLIAMVGEQETSVVLTLRTQHLSSHAGQISFPGGRVDITDASPEQTALREAHEEIGLHPSSVSILGRLPDYTTATGYCVTPVIGKIHLPVSYVVETREVERVFQVPLQFLMNPANHQVRTVPEDASPTGERFQFYAMPYYSVELQTELLIWGATAAMLRNLYHFLHAAWHQNPSNCNFEARR
jgi:8-oxo-dGTP pyrophosphatase MutT (NUDIX family)